MLTSSGLWKEVCMYAGDSELKICVEVYIIS